MPTYKLKKSFKLLISLLISLLLVFSSVPYEARAATGIYGRLNFQGKVVNSNGTNVSDGTYDFVFKIYDGASSGASILWTESWTSGALWSSTMSSAPDSGGESLVYASDTNESTLKVGQTLWNTTKEEAVTITSVDAGSNTLGISPTRQAWAVSDTVTNKIYVKDGIFSVQLNSLNADWSSVDWNSDSLFLGVNFNSDGEMKPRKRLTAVPYAHNADLLNGLSSGSLLRSDASDNYTSGTLTLDAGTILDVNGTLALGGATILESLDMANNIITNIGNAGTDFDSSGGLTLAGDLLLDKIDTATLTVTEYPSLDLILRGSGWKMGSADWNFRKKITIDHTKVDDNLTDFPLLINLSSDSDLASWAQDDGDDIYFTENDGVTKLDHEIEKFDGSTGELIAWVRIPSLSSTTDTEIYMYYANPGASNQENVTGVWNSNFKMVQHLHETSKTAGTYNDHLDSTLNNNDGEAENGVTMDATGKINGADDFDGSDDYVEVADSASLDITSEVTVEAWVNDPTIVEQIAASYDDGACDDSVNYPTDTYANCATAWIKAGLRWGMNIPEGAIISSAYIRVKSGDNSSGTDDGKIELFDEDDATDFSASFWTRAVDSGAGSVTWDYLSWTINEWYDSPDISSLVQAFIDRPGYSPGNYIGLRITGLSEVGDWRSFLTYDSAPADAPELHVEYVLPIKRIVGKEIDAYEIQIDNDLNVTGFINNQSVTTLTTKAWHYIVLAYNGSEQRLYVDGVLKDSAPLSGSINTNANNLIIGEYVSGPIDEVRISNTARGAEWVSTTHSNHDDPDSFYSLSSQEGLDGGAVDRDVILRNIITYDYYNDPISRLAFLNSGDIEFVSLDATNQGVGIGTTEPGAKLTVQKTGASLRLQSDGIDQHTFIEFYKDGGVSSRSGYFGYPDDLEVIMVLNNEIGDLIFQPFGYNVGIGTEEPNKKLDVEGAVEVNLPGTGTGHALCHTTQTGTVGEEIVDCTERPTADYAEQFSVAEDIEYGNLVVTGERIVTTTDGHRVVQLVKSSRPYQENLIGIVSNNYDDFTSAGYNIKEEDNPMPVALVGRVLVKASLESGPITIGDPLTSSSQPGVAMKATKAGFTVGRALEPYDNPDPNAVGEIMVFVNLGWYNPQVVVDGGGDLAQGTAEGVTEKIVANEIEVETGIFQKLTVVVGAIFDHFIAKTAEIAEAVIGNLQTVTLNVTGELISPIADIKEINSEQLTTDRLKIREEGEMVGEETIPAGETELVIENAEVTENSRIFVTPTTSTGGQALFVSEKKVGESFTISIDKELETDIIFNFWVIN